MNHKKYILTISASENDMDVDELMEWLGFHIRRDLTLNISVSAVDVSIVGSTLYLQTLKKSIEKHGMYCGPIEYMDWVAS